MASREPDPTYEYAVIHGPACRVLAGWAVPMADISALLGAWAREGYRYTSTPLAHAWGVAAVALKDPAAEAAADAWYRARQACQESAPAA